MKKSDLLRIKQIIMDSKDYLSFKKSLTLLNPDLTKSNTLLKRVFAFITKILNNLLI